MADDPLDRVRRLALALPAVEEGTSYRAPAWKVGGRTFAWDRPLRAADREALGDAAPAGTVLGVSVPDLGAKEALLAGEGALFTTPHFDGHASVLVDLARASDALLAELLDEAWRCQAPRRVLREHDRDADRDADRDTDSDADR